MAIDSQQLTTLLEILGAERLALVRQSYLSDSASKMQALGQSVAEQDWHAVNQLSHSLKSASANLALLSLADLLAQMEAQSAQEQGDSMQRLYEAAQSEYDRSVAELNAAF